MVLLGVNIDHVATVRNARGGLSPDPLQAALIAEDYGADGITVHLREDRRHIKDADLIALKFKITTRLNLEMANTPEMVQIALEIKPYMVTLVPERRQELTTEGGLDVSAHRNALTETVNKLTKAGILVSLFIDPDAAQLKASQETGASYIELHTGAYSQAYFAISQTTAVNMVSERKIDLDQTLVALTKTATDAHQLGLRVNAGHGLNYQNIKPILNIPHLEELNIGHSIIAHSIFTGLGPAVQLMKKLLSE
ncbi:MAG: pyridoxine 5'-phosphate synthase [Cyanobacteria bacterium P01_H01_bin.74]